MEFRRQLEQVLEDDELAQAVAHRILGVFSQSAAMPVVKASLGGAGRLALMGVHGEQDLQHRIHVLARPIFELMGNRFSTTFSDQYKPRTGHLLIGPHYAILDPVFIKEVFLDHGLPAPAAVVGDNLLGLPWVRNLFECTGCITIPRDKSACLKGAYSVLGERIEKGEAVWIAQKGSRCSDGRVETDPRVIQGMYLMARAVAHTRSPSECLDFISPTPISIQYDWHPCDGLIAQQRARRLAGGGKRRGEDELTMGEELFGEKGTITLHVHAPIRSQDREDCSPGAVARAIDDTILDALRPTQFQYAAHLQLYGGRAQYHDLTPDEKFFVGDDAFERVAQRVASRSGGCEQRRRFILELYANPVQQRVERGYDLPWDIS